jgi:hypothetical protein
MRHRRPRVQTRRVLAWLAGLGSHALLLAVIQNCVFWPVALLESERGRVPQIQHSMTRSRRNEHDVSFTLQRVIGREREFRRKNLSGVLAYLGAVIKNAVLLHLAIQCLLLLILVRKPALRVASHTDGNVQQLFKFPAPSLFP